MKSHSIQCFLHQIFRKTSWHLKWRRLWPEAEGKFPGIVGLSWRHVHRKKSLESKKHGNKNKCEKARRIYSSATGYAWFGKVVNQHSLHKRKYLWMADLQFLTKRKSVSFCMLQRCWIQTSQTVDQPVSETLLNGECFLHRCLKHRDPS